MFKSDAIVHDPLVGWRVTLPQVALEALLKRSVELISEGMAAPLNEMERRAANRLAGLGEVFSQEAAFAIFENAEPIIESLIFKGFLVNTGLLTPPLPGSISRYPLLAFTHTLLHKHFIQTSDPILSSIVRIIADDYPIYSILPFQLLAELGCPNSVPLGIVRKTIQRALGVAAMLDQGPDWESATSVWEAATTLFECRREEWDEGDRCRLLADLYGHKLSLMRRDGVSEEFEAWVGRFIDLTQRMNTDECAVQRLMALNHLITLQYRRGNGIGRDVWQEIEEILHRFPHLYFSTEYVNCLQNIANIAVAIQDNVLIETIEHQLTYILGSDSASQQVRKLARTKIGPLFLTRFSTQRELQSRMKLLAELEELNRNDNDLLFPNQKFALLSTTGRVEEMCEGIQERLPSVIARGLTRTAVSWQIMSLIHRTAFGSDLEEVESEIARLYAETSDRIPQTFDAMVAAGLCAAALLRDEIPFCREVIGRYLGDQRQLPPPFRVLLALDADNRDEELRQIHGQLDCPQPLRLLLDTLSSGTVPVGFAESIGKFFARPILRTRDIILARAAIDLLEAIADGGTAVKELKAEVRGWLVRALTWTTERSLFAFSFPLIRRYGRYLGKNDLTKWTNRVQGIARAYQTRAGSPGSRLDISMLGTITIRKPDEEPNTIRGSRLRLLLGLMVADRMLEHPLSHREFCRLVSSGETDPDYARKVMNGAVWRLRDVLGYDAICTDGETPQLNQDVVTVDLLEAHTLLEKVDQILRVGTIMHATPLLLKVLEITNGEVAFPTLYDSFFEAARVDFECRLRATVIEISKRLISEGDTIRAEEVLHRAHAAIPGDDEISELLCKTLVMHDKRTEAERVRMQDLQTTA
jgi:DNA-binding SARP family transcriptional activator